MWDSDIDSGMSILNLIDHVKYHKLQLQAKKLGQRPKLLYYTSLQCHPWKTTSTNRLKDQGANTSTLIVPCELAANMVGLSLFQHTALMKCGDTSSSLSSGFDDPNLCREAGFEIA